MTDPRPYYQHGTHPVEIGRVYKINTGSTFRLYKTTCKWILGARSGCLVYGTSTIGKSHAIEVVKDFLRDKFPKMRVLLFEVQKHKNRTEKEFFRNMLLSFEHEKANSGNAGEKLQTIVDFIVEEAHSNIEKRILIFVDEAQWLIEDEYGYLRGLYNWLINRKIVPFFILVGSEKLYKNYKEYLEREEFDIIGRFMNDVLHFEGIKSEKQLSLALHSYDITENPGEKGWSYSRYFYTAAYDKGWRLRQESHTFWTTYLEILNELQTRDGIKRKAIKPNLFASHFTRAVEYVFREISDFHELSPDITTDQWRKALLYAGLNDYHTKIKEEPDIEVGIPLHKN